MLKLKDLAEISLDRVKKDKDLAVIISGAEGDGKSALSIGYGYEVDPLFLLERNILFRPQVSEISKKIYNLPPYTPIIADEAIKIMYKLNWSTRLQKFLNQIYAVCRSQNKISVFNIPRITDVNEYFRNHRARLWVHIIDPISSVKKKGYAVVMTRSWNPVTSDPWGISFFEGEMKRIQKKTRKRDTSYTLDEKISLFSRMPSFIDVMEFNWISSRIWQQYEALKNKASFTDDELMSIDVDEIKRTEWRTRTLTSIKTFEKMGYTRLSIAKLFGITSSTIANWINKEKRKREIDEFNAGKWKKV